MHAKRQRTISESAQRVVIDVGGTKFSTTVATIERSSYLHGMIDASAWQSDPSHCAEIFLDRDPEIFSQLLRLMRQTPHAAGLIPTEPRACASVIAEADYFGFDPLLVHVKTVAYYNSRDAKEDYPKFERPPIPTNPTQAELEAHRNACSLARKDYRQAIAVINKSFADRDEAHAVSKFDEIYGSIGEALAKGVLPHYFFAPKPSQLKPFTKIIQLTPVDATTWFLVGDMDDRRAYPSDDDTPEGSTPIRSVPLTELFSMPAMVRRVACHALVENETGKRWVEPMVHLEPEDQESWMSDQPGDGLIHNATRGDARLPEHTETGGHRTMLASEWIKKALYDGLASGWIDDESVWSHVLVADSPPEECAHESIHS